MPRARVQRVREHLIMRGPDVPAPEELQEDLRAMVRGCEELRARGGEYTDIELSPFMKSLLRISGLTATEDAGNQSPRESYVVAGV
jgi:hypothetical protein